MYFYKNGFIHTLTHTRKCTQIHHPTYKHHFESYNVLYAVDSKSNVSMNALLIEIVHILLYRQTKLAEKKSYIPARYIIYIYFFTFVLSF